MSDIVLEIAFHQREQAMRIPVARREYERLAESLKCLAMGDTHIHNFFLLPMSDTALVLFSIKDLQYIHCLEKGATAKAPVVEGLEIYLHNRTEPLTVQLDPDGPIHDLLLEMLETHYGDDPQGCVMTPDLDGNPLFFRPDDVDCIFLNARYLAGYRPE
jgi:hypothetical protein